MRTSDGRTLFTRYTRTSVRDIRDTPIGKFDFGYVRLGPAEEWIRDPDGTEYRGSHMAALMATVEQPKKGFCKRLWTKLK